MRMHRVACVVIAAIALAQRGADAACPPGVTKPEVTTVIASASTTDTALVVEPSCDYITVPMASTLVGVKSYVFQQSNIDRVASLPSGATGVLLTSRLSRGADFSNANELLTVVLDDFDARLIDDLKLPSKLSTLMLSNSTSLKSVDKLSLPSTLTSLSLLGLGISSLKTIPSSLTLLYLSENAFTSINFALPPQLYNLDMKNNPIRTLERVTFPDSLEIFSCSGCGIKKIRGVKWSKKLTTLDLGGYSIEEFELRQSDFDVLNKQTKISLTTSLSTCSDEQATPKDLQGSRVCVISDEQFEALYSSVGETTKSPSSDGESGSSSPSGDDPDGGSNRTNGTRSGSNGGSQLAEGQNIAPGATGGGGGTTETIYVKTAAPISPTVVAILIAVSSVFGTLLAVVGYRLYRTSRRNKEKTGEMPGTTLMPFDTPMFTTNQDPSDGGTSQEYLSNDIRNDKSIIPYRIDQKEISLSKQIARGGFGVIFRGVYSGRAVAVKQMLPEAWRNETQLVNFMDEIRLCASLTHPKIVEFIGVAWTSLRDISVIIEFMDGGDLFSVIQKHAIAQSLSSSTTSFASGGAASSQSSTSYVPSRHEWSGPWTTAAINSKTSIARDVAEAVVYLHSFSNPILHRDLKARNVLLDARGNAKLSDFGISREMATDETMTSEVGTSAWIAPEVLRGDRYSERADIYSFGVLLVELDKCRHPYAGEETLMLMDGSSIRLGPVPRQQPHRQAQETRSQAMHQNMKIAMLVSAGHLRPRPSETCPSRVQSLISRCLSFAPEDRPSAMEAHYELRQILAELSELHCV